MKKFICAVFASLMMTTAVHADVNVLVNGVPVQYSDQAPVIINERTYIPIRDVFEKLGFKVDWDGESKAVTISDDYYIIVLMTRTNGMVTAECDLDFTYRQLENTVQIINGRTMLPLREILESVGYELGWDAETKSAIVNDKNNYDLLKTTKAETEKVFSNENKTDYKELLNQKLTDKSEQEQRYCLGVATIIGQLGSTDGAKALAELNCPRSMQQQDKALKELFREINNDKMAYSVFKGQNYDAQRQNKLLQLLTEDAVKRAQTKAWEILETL